MIDPGSCDDNSLLKGLCTHSFQNSSGAKPRERTLPRYGKPLLDKKSGVSGDGVSGQISSLRLAGGSSSSSRDTLEVVYEVCLDLTTPTEAVLLQESDEDLNSVFSNDDDDLSQLIHNNNNNDTTEELKSKSAFISSSSPTSYCHDSILNEEEWRALKKDLDNACVLVRKLLSKEEEGLLGGDSKTRTSVVLDEVGETVQIYPLAGAFLGSCLGGPVGFLAGVKIGGLAAVGGGILGELESKCSIN